ncbi:MAG: Asp-tRNA(Asn)/Glu-tRNA(Gln) amidotransferase subunit GatC [Gammaproteobacteria bacterium]|nr:Asp-tRNA(Asn)/Glu-tRNA(Gln) amidotransferase subunit GatC [Gammaproteobacteria bacterium]
MALDSKTVQDIARLARLRVSVEETTKFGTELSNILDLVAQMEAADTDNIEPMTHPFDATLRMRNDQVTETNQRDKFQSIAPSAENGLYLVPRVID